MQSLLPLGNPTLAALPAATDRAIADAIGSAAGQAAQSGQADAATGAPSASVTLTDPETAGQSQTYAADGSLAVLTPVWEQDAHDRITTVLADNYHASTLADRFRNLGSTLLERLQSNNGNYSQSIILKAPDSNGDTSASRMDQVRQTQLHAQSDNQVVLDIKTAGGATVHVSLSSQGDNLGVQIQITGGTLSDAERNAIAGLADAFQQAVDGLTSVPPRLALDGLAGFDPAVLSSVDLQSSFKLAAGGVQTLAFHADSQKRSVAYAGAAGSINVDVDMSNRALIGSAEQQSRALAAYLQQFGQAESRGRGDANLMAMFKDAFTTLNSNYGASPARSISQPAIFTDVDNALLTGLADFSASVTQSASPLPVNPMLPAEKDSFSYGISQSTKVDGGDVRDHSIEQTQDSHLTASFHTALYPDTSLMLTDDPKSQNYYYYQMADSASSVTRIGYKDGRLVQASVAQTARQSTHVMKYVMGKLEENITTPAETTRSWNLLDLLQSAKPPEHGSTELERAHWQNTLSAAGNLAIMKAGPSQLDSAGLYIADAAQAG